MFFRRNIAHCSVNKLTIIIMATLLGVIQSYNLNVNKAKVFSHPHKYHHNRKNYFGYTVALYNNPTYDDQSVLVGAPRANTSQTLVIEPGAVYKCTLNSNCNEWSLDNTFGQLYDSGKIFRDNSWLGASISVENAENPRVVVCAPRWKIKWNSEWYMNGICYYAEINTNRSFDDTYITRIMSFTDRRHQTAADSRNIVYYKYGMGLLGFSMHTYSYENQWGAILGSPGAHSSLGTAVLVSRNTSGFNHFIPDYDSVEHVYLGYSVTSGNYFNNNVFVFAAGVPRSNDMKGQVRVFHYNSHIEIIGVTDTLYGTQKGEYFGAALTSCDIDNDGKDEIIVGAPLWTKKGDEGSVRVFSTKNTKKFKLSMQINGEVKDARFGTTVVCLGDIDRDGYQDIAVGAPYENNHGAVYIFNGNQQGLSSTWSQRISGDEFSHNLQGFGISISQPRDIDGNGYFDVAIGAYLSGHAVILRSQPVVSVNIKIYSKRMKLSRDENSFPVRICCSYKGVRSPNSLNTIIKLKVDVAHERVYIEKLKREDRTYNMAIKLFRESTCRNITILLKERIANVIDPIEISASLILDPEFQYSSISSNNFYFNSPVINKNMATAEDNITLEFAVDCGNDNICNSNITLDIETNLGKDNRFVLGSKNTVKLFIDVHNYGEAAYEAQTHIFIPESMTLMNIPENCEPTRSTGISEVICNIGNPLTKQNNFTLELVMRPTGSIEKHVEVTSFVTTRSNNINHNQSKRNLTIYFDDDVDIAVSGNAYEPSYTCFDEQHHKLEIIKFQHVYEVHNFGVTPISQLHLTISIPTYIIDQKNKSKIEIAKINRTDISLSGSLINGPNSYCIHERTKNMNNELKYLEVNNNPDNRTLYINCTNPLIICEIISCYFETTSSSLTIGAVTITMELQLKNFTDNVMNGTNIIYFISNGHINITSPTGIIQKPGNKPDYIQVETTFDSSTAIATSQRIPIWIIALSALLGLLLLALLTFGLIKLGFFHRKKKEELETLKSNEDKKHNIILETTSSSETLDRD